MVCDRFELGLCLPRFKINSGKLWSPIGTLLFFYPRLTSCKTLSKKCNFNYTPFRRLAPVTVRFQFIFYWLSAVVNGSPMIIFVLIFKNTHEKSSLVLIIWRVKNVM